MSVTPSADFNTMQPQLERYVPDGAPKRAPVDMDRREYNCYAHGLGLQKLGWVQPGCLKDRYADLEDADLSVQDRWRERFLSDGWIEVDLKQANPLEALTIAVKTTNHGSYHVYRFDDDGQVSNKRGPWGVDVLNKLSNTFWGALGRGYRDPQSYTAEDFLANEEEKFVGFFVAPEDGFLYDPSYRGDTANNHVLYLREMKERQSRAELRGAALD